MEKYKKSVTIANNKMQKKQKCGLFCFQQCSDKYQELVVRKQQSFSNQPYKLSLKRIAEDHKKQIQLKKMHKFRTSSQSSRYDRQYHPQLWIHSTNRSRLQSNSPVKQLQLFQKQNKIYNQFQNIQHQTQNITLKYLQKLTTLQNIKSYIHNNHKNNYNTDNQNSIHNTDTNNKYLNYNSVQKDQCIKNSKGHKINTNQSSPEEALPKQNCQASKKIQLKGKKISLNELKLRRN